MATVDTGALGDSGAGKGEDSDGDEALKEKWSAGVTGMLSSRVGMTTEAGLLTFILTVGKREILLNKDWELTICVVVMLN